MQNTILKQGITWSMNQRGKERRERQERANQAVFIAVCTSVCVVTVLLAIYGAIRFADRVGITAFLRGLIDGGLS